MSTAASASSSPSPPLSLLLPPPPPLEPLLPLREPSEPPLRVQLPPAGQHRYGGREHDGDRVGVVGVGRDLRVLAGDLVELQVVVVVVAVVLVVVDAGHNVGHGVEHGHDGPKEDHLADACNISRLRHQRLLNGQLDTKRFKCRRGCSANLAFSVSTISFNNYPIPS